jgi:hypothetical protein
MAKTQKTGDTREAAPKAKKRQIKPDRYTSFKLQKKIKPETGKVPGSFRLFGRALAVLKRNWKVFLGIVVIYGLLNVVLVQGLSAGGNLTEIKDSLDELFTGNLAQLVTGATLFIQMLSTSGNTGNPAAGAYQLILVLTVSLALIWTLRQVYAGHKVRIRDGFYRGMTPLVPFVLVLCVIGLQLIPAFIGGFLYAQVTTGDIAVTAAEHVLWAAVFFILALISLYMVCSSLFALYIASLPDMAPLAALRSARNLVRHRRWTVMRKVIFLPFALIVLAGVIVIPLIIFATPFATWTFFVLSMAVIAVVHSYMYALYRSLL